MTTDLQKTGSAEIVPQQAPIEFKDEFNAIIFMAAKDPSVDVGKMQALLDMKRQVEGDRARVAFMEAFNAAQTELRPIVKTAENKHTGSRYALMEQIDRDTKPIYTKYGFTLTFSPHECPKEDHVRLSCTLFHKGGHRETYGPFDLHVDSEGAKGTRNKTPIQGQGSAFAYGRRYMKLLVFDLTLTDEDNDGNAEGLFISQDEAAQVFNLMREAGLATDNEKFLAWAGADSIQHIQPIALDRVVTELKARKAKREAQ